MTSRNAYELEAKLNEHDSKIDSLIIRIEILEKKTGTNPGILLELVNQIRRTTLEDAKKAIESANPVVRADIMERYGLNLGWKTMQAECVRKINDLITALGVTIPTGKL